MTDFALTRLPQAHPRRAARPGRPPGLAGAIHYGGVLLVWAGLLVIRPSLALKVMRERRADSPIPRRGR